MSVYKDLKIREFGRGCRHCINENYGLSLKPDHCVYLPYPAVCHRCSELRNIVIDIRPKTRLFLGLFGKKRAHN